MDFSIECECGRQLRISHTMCGDERQCKCGKRILVPKLSELRSAAGLQAFEVSIQDRLHAMGRDGLLPVENKCVICGTDTSKILACAVECERPFAKGPGIFQMVIAVVLLPIALMVQIMREHANPEIHGNELLIDTPIRLCDSCYQARRMSVRACRQLLLKTDLYSALLNVYPKATIHVDPVLR